MKNDRTWHFVNREIDYHWVVDLYERLKLLVLPEVVHKATQERMKKLEKKKTEETKQKRISQKVTHAEDQGERKK